MTAPKVIVVPPLTAFMYAMIKVNGCMASMMRYWTGRTSWYVLVFLTVMWLYLVLMLLPGMFDFLLCL